MSIWQEMPPPLIRQLLLKVLVQVILLPPLTFTRIMPQLPEKISAIAVTPAVVTQDLLDGITDAFFSNAKIYTADSYYVQTKDEIKKKIDELKEDVANGNLDPNNSWEIMKLLEEINESGTTVVVVTHNREIVNAMQKRVITMKKGVIISDEEKGGYIDED